MDLLCPRLGRKLLWQFYDNWDEAVKAAAFQIETEKG